MQVAPPPPVEVVARPLAATDPPPPRPPSRRWSTLVAPGVTVAVVVGATVFVFLQLHPGLIFGPNDDVGGDNAAHIAAAAFLIHNLLPHFAISGWDPEWFGGFPLYVFYFPLPALLIALLNPIFGYAVAFKIITILGTLLMPTAAYVFGRGAGFARPIPALMSVATLPFLFNTSYTIDGGNIVSTLAGEFSFTLSMAFGLMFLGVLASSLRTGRLRWLAALLFAATILCHVIPAIVTGLAALLLLLLSRPSRARVTVVVAVGGVGALLAAFWLFRFKADLLYTSSMGYSKVTDPLGAAGLLPHSGEIAVQILACIGAVVGVWILHRVVLVLVGTALGSALAFIALPSGLVYNGRWLPFWFLSTALLAAYALGVIGKLLAAPLAHVVAHEWLTPAIVGVVVLVVIGGYLGILPTQSQADAASFVPSWTAWNYSGYQAKSGWPEFERIIAMLDSVGRRYGCGNLDYEYSPNVNTTFGSTIVEMSFPFWTNGCIGSAEGLYYESSTSTPFHFLDQSELSIQASNPIPSLPYASLNVADGIRHLQLTGVRYFLANSPTVEAQAAADPQLTELASTPENPAEVDGVTSGAAGPSAARWIVYAVANSALVTPLAYAPVVEGGMSKASRLAMAIHWYQHEAEWPVEVATNGPASWRRVPAGSVVGPGEKSRLPSMVVTHIATSIDTVHFTVSRIGVPVLVKIPYFPNWQAHGATGPYPVTPNLMVVVPTQRNVTLKYGTTTVDWLGRFGTAAGVAGLVALRTPIDPGPEAGATLLSTRTPEPTPPTGVPRELWWRDPNGIDDGPEDAVGEDRDDDDSDDPGPIDLPDGGSAAATPTGAPGSGPRSATAHPPDRSGE